MEEHQWDALLLVDSRNVYYLEGILLPRAYPVLLWIERDRPALLITDSNRTPASAETVLFESYSPRRVLTPPWRQTANLFSQQLTGCLARTIGVEKDEINGSVLETLKAHLPKFQLVDIGDVLANLRRTRDPDEIDVLRRISNVADAGFQRAREILRPELSEVDVYVEICAAMVKEAGEPVEVEGDFASGPRSVTAGGPPTGRFLEAGDLCVFDLSPMCWGYQADLTRTMAVGTPSQLQERGLELVGEALKLAERLLQPGCPAREIYNAVHEFFEQDELSAGTFWHHLGHGIGMGGHEDPRLVPESDHVLREGDVISVEPGIYNPKLKGGLRIENTYWLSPQGTVQLNSHPTNL